MISYVYQKALAYDTSEKLLLDLKQTVAELRAHHPELETCSLRDLSIEPNQRDLNVTLYFQTKN